MQHGRQAPQSSQRTPAPPPRCGRTRRAPPATVLVALVGIATAVAMPAWAQAPNLVAEGSFEHWFFKDSLNISPPLNLDIGSQGYPWHGVMRTIDANQLPFGPAPDGNMVGVWRPFFQIQPVPLNFKLQQDLATTAGHVYWLSYELATSAPTPTPNQPGGVEHHVIASFGNVPVDVGHQTNQGFTHYARKVTAYGPTTTLTFRDNLSADTQEAFLLHSNFLAIDQVSVTDTAIDAHPGAEAAPHSWALGNGHTGHFYQLVVAPQGIGWAEAAAAAASMGGTLAQGGSPEALQFLATVATDDTRTWLPSDSGATRGPWLGLRQQLNFDPVSFDFSRREGAPDALAAGFIVEWATAPVPEPATAGLAALGLGALCLRLRRRR